MISHGRSPTLEKLLSTGDNIRPTTGINCDQNPNTLESLYSFPRMNVETTSINSINDRTLGPSLASVFGRNEVAPYLMNIGSDNRAQMSTIWMRDSTGLGSLHYYQPDVQLSYSENAHCRTLPLSERTNVLALGLPGLLNISSEEPSSWTMSPDVYSPANMIPNLPAETNCALGSPFNTSVRLSSNSASNRLRHVTSLFCQQDNYNPHFSSEQCNRLSHYGVPCRLNQKDGSITISTACVNQHPTPTTTTNCYRQPQMQATSGISNQIFPNIYQFDVLPQSTLNQYLLESQANSQIYNEIQHAHPELSNSCLYNSSLSSICASTCLNEQPFVSHSIPGNTSQEIVQNYANTCLAHETTPLVHQPDDTSVDDADINEPCKKSSCLYEKNLKTFSPKFNEEDVERKTVPKNYGNRSSCLEKEARIWEKAEAQVNELTSSPKKEQKTSVKTWECPVCSRKLARAYCLKIHMRQHSGDRPFKCPVCPRTFAQQTLLLSHRRTHNGKRAHSCPTCHKMFVHLGALKTHVNTHTGVRPHKCAVPGCGVAFADSSTLAKHARVHSGERPFVCDICGRRFTQSGNMNKHKKTVHKAIDSSPVGKTRVLENTMLLSEIFGNTGNKMCTATTDVSKMTEDLINRRVEKSSPGDCVARTAK